MINNPYIDLVKNHEKIIVDTQKMRNTQWKWWDFFANKNPLILEIGTGLGNFFSKQVQENSEKNYLGMEIRYKRLYQTAEKCLWNKATYSQNNITPSPERGGLGRGNWTDSELNKDNFVLLKEYWEKIWEIFWEWELSECYIFFPDPWAKKKSQLKNRLLQRQFLNDLFSVMWDDAKVVIKTDHREYFDFCLWEIEKTDWKINYKSYDFENEPEFQNSETTEFQQLFRGQDIKINHVELGK
jgi:tRNA (guanine-N7-)-methyltransferase